MIQRLDSSTNPLQPIPNLLPSPNKRFPLRALITPLFLTLTSPIWQHLMTTKGPTHEPTPTAYTTAIDHIKSQTTTTMNQAMTAALVTAPEKTTDPEMTIIPIVTAPDITTAPIAAVETTAHNTTAHEITHAAITPEDINANAETVAAIYVDVQDHVNAITHVTTVTKGHPMYLAIKIIIIVIEIIITATKIIITAIKIIIILLTEARVTKPEPTIASTFLLPHH